MPIDITFDTRYQTDGSTLTSDAAGANLSFQVTSASDSVAVGDTVTVVVLNNGVPTATSFLATYDGQTADGELLLTNQDSGQQLLATNNLTLSSGDALPPSTPIHWSVSPRAHGSPPSAARCRWRRCSPGTW